MQRLQKVANLGRQGRLIANFGKRIRVERIAGDERVAHKRLAHRWIVKLNKGWVRNRQGEIGLNGR